MLGPSSLSRATPQGVADLEESFHPVFTSGRGWSLKVGHIIVSFQYPLEGIRKLNEKVWGRLQAEGEAWVDIVVVLPINTQKFPILLSHWYHPEGGLGQFWPYAPAPSLSRDEMASLW